MLFFAGLPRNIRRWDLSGEEKTVLLSTFCVKLIAFYQDRLGTGPRGNSKSRTFSGSIPHMAGGDWAERSRSQCGCAAPRD